MEYPRSFSDGRARSVIFAARLPGAMARIGTRAAACDPYGRNNRLS